MIAQLKTKNNSTKIPPHSLAHFITLTTATPQTISQSHLDLGPDYE